jgi:hypothetical protein
MNIRMILFFAGNWFQWEDSACFELFSHAPN